MKITTLYSGSLLLLMNTFIACSSNQQVQQGSKQGQQRERPTAEQLFAQMDANKDGMLTLEEVKGPIKDDFAKIDTDNDGNITKEELENAPKPERNSNGNRGPSRRGQF